MVQRFFYQPMMFVLCGFLLLSASPGNGNNNSSNRPSIPGVKPGVSEGSSQSQRSQNGHRGGGREEIAQADWDKPPYPETGPFRMGDWDFRGNWRYNRDAFYRGETQQQAYREEHPYGPGGIGYDADVNYMRNLRRYREIYHEHPSTRNKARIEDYENPYHVQRYRGDFGEGSYNDAYGNPNSGNNSNSGYYEQNSSR